MKAFTLLWVTVGVAFLLLGSGCTEVEDVQAASGSVDAGDSKESNALIYTGAGELEAVVFDEMNETHTPGVAVAVVSGDKIVFARGFGVSNIETGTPVTPDTLFRIGSTTKMYTAATLAMLAEDGKLDLNEPIGSYVDGLSPGLSQLTTHQLLTHTAGLRDEASSYGRHDEAALSEEVRAFDDSLFFTGPGEIFSYSNPGYALAGLVAEETGDKSYADQVKESLFLPLGMNRTTFRPTEAMTFPLAQGHYLLPDGSPAVIRPYTDNAGNWPAGFMFSNVNELSRFAIAFMNEGRLEGKEVLSPSAISKLSTPYSPVISSYNNGSYGYGLFIHNSRGVQIVEHPGGMEGFTCQFLMVPEHRFAVIILSNTYGTKFPKSTEKAMELFLPLEAEMEEDSEANVSLPVTGDGMIDESITDEGMSGEEMIGKAIDEEVMTEEEMTAYAGHYYNSPELYLDLVKKDDTLFLKIGELEAPVKKIGESRFLATNPFLGQPLEFILVPGEDGKPEYLHMSHRALKKI
ncbi:MAG: serine hydrolase domain-containing protein [Methanosarcinaceae archaeon]